MKIRLGFVSNSSTTSFVLIGYIVDDEIAKKYISEKTGRNIDEIEDVDDEIYNLKDRYIKVFSELGIAIGYSVLVSSDEAMKEGEIDDFSKIMSDVDEIGKKLGLGKPKLITGSFSS